MLETTQVLGDDQDPPVAEALELGVMTPTGRVRWAEPRSMSSQAGVRYLL